MGEKVSALQNYQYIDHFMLNSSSRENRGVDECWEEFTMNWVGKSTKESGPFILNKRPVGNPWGL